MEPVFVDTGILLRSEDGSDRARQAAALRWLERLWRERSGRLGSQTLNDFYLLATSRLNPPMPAGDARAEVRRYALWRPWQVDQATVESAWALESRYGLHFADGLVVAAAQHLGCRYLLSDELPHQAQFGAVQVINPFLVGPELLDQA